MRCVVSWVLLGLALLLINAESCSAFSFRRSAFRDPVTAGYGRASAATAASLLRSAAYNWTTLYYEQQIVDHFGWDQKARFTQKYLINADSWTPPGSAGGPGPIFFYCGNEGYIETFAGNSGFMFDIAPQYGALLIFVEHRYYGSSFPFGSAEAAYANSSSLQYLTSEQAIADYVQFLDWFKSDPSTLCGGQCGAELPVVGFGGSYGAMLAAWQRIKYPWSLRGAITASAPIWQFVGMVDPRVYTHIITEDYKLATPHCSRGIQRGWDIIDHMSQSQQGLQELTRIFRPCNISTLTAEQVYAVYGFLSEAFGFMAMADYPYPASFLGSMPAYPVSYGCLKFFKDVDPDTADNTTVLQAVYGVATIFSNYSGQAGQCNDLYSQGPPSLGTQDGWDYQCCTEMVQAIGQYGGDSDMFPVSPFDLDGYIAGCQQPFGRGGWGTTPRPQWIAQEYGGLNLKAASRIFFSSGSLDPWSGLSPNATAMHGAYGPDNPRGVVCYMMEGAAHHLDLRGRNDADPKIVRQVREIEKAYISAWLMDEDRPSDAELQRAMSAVASVD